VALSQLPYLASAYLLLVGLYGIVTSRHLVHVANCVLVIQSSTYILLLAIGYERGASAPVVDSSLGSRGVVDPVVQALTLTDIVVGAAVASLVLALAIQTQKRHHTLDPSELRAERG
jgi:multicomponent Na+:H+ antiporter subunit C